MNSSPKLTIELSTTAGVRLLLDDHVLFGFEEVTLEACPNLLPRVKVTLLNVREAPPESQRELKRINRRNRELLSQLPYVEVFEAGSIPGAHVFSNEDEPTQA